LREKKKRRKKIGIVIKTLQPGALYGATKATWGHFLTSANECNRKKGDSAGRGQPYLEAIPRGGAVREKGGQIFEYRGGKVSQGSGGGVGLLWRCSAKGCPLHEQRCQGLKKGGSWDRARPARAARKGLAGCLGKWGRIGTRGMSSTRSKGGKGCQQQWNRQAIICK